VLFTAVAAAGAVPEVAEELEVTQASPVTLTVRDSPILLVATAGAYRVPFRAVPSAFTCSTNIVAAAPVVAPAVAAVLEATTVESERPGVFIPCVITDLEAAVAVLLGAETVTVQVAVAATVVAAPEPPV